jgi:hypothetical protein
LRKSLTTSYRCSGCHKQYYCSKTCQRSHWPTHIFDCAPTGGAIKTAYHLKRAVAKDLVPTDELTRKDYGFTRCVDAREESMLFGLYVGAIQYLETDPRELHRWQKSGTLAVEIKNAYEKRGHGVATTSGSWRTRGSWTAICSIQAEISRRRRCGVPGRS